MAPVYAAAGRVERRTQDAAVVREVATGSRHRTVRAGRVIAPTLAEETSAACLVSTPDP